MAMRQDLIEAQEETILGIPIKRLILWLSLTVAALIAIMVIWMLTHNRYVVTADVIEVDAPNECWQEFDSNLFRKGRESARTKAPRRSYLGYCGVIRTSMGDFELPETYPRPWMGQSRDELHSRVRAGCRYDFVVLSDRGRPRARDRGRSTKTPARVRRILFTYPC